MISLDGIFGYLAFAACVGLVLGSVLGWKAGRKFQKHRMEG